MSETLSIVIIGRNEEKSICACIDAARAAAARVGGAEIVFVDSASTDKTVDVVSSLGVDVLQLPAELRRCPSAGRFAGFSRVSGDFILFLDADTRIYPDFLPAALDHLRSHPDVAGVNGRIDDLDENGHVIAGYEDRFDDLTDVKWLRGPSCLYRRKALLEVGSFNPQIAMEEEAELGLRIVNAGWRLHLLAIPMSCHTRCFHVHTFRGMISTFRRDISAGRLGEITRTVAYAFRAGNGIEFCWLRLKTTIVFAAWAFATVLVFLLPLPFPTLPTVLALAGLGLLAIFAKKRDVRQTLLFVPNKILCLVDICSGFHKIGRANDGLLRAPIVGKTVQ
ncbi:MAG: glycosyltransferase family 2 protein [Pyrinomonadaceae bacterium]